MRHFITLILNFFARSFNAFEQILNIKSLRLKWATALWRARLGRLGENSNIYPLVIINNPKRVKIGNGCNIAEFVHIRGGGEVEIGDNVLIASHTVITSTTHDTNADVYALSSIRAKVKIESNVWIGSGVTILPGLTIGRDAVIGAGSVVTKNVPPKTINAGIPSRVVKTLPNES